MRAEVAFESVQTEFAASRGGLRSVPLPTHGVVRPRLSDGAMKSSPLPRPTSEMSHGRSRRRPGPWGPGLFRASPSVEPQVTSQPSG
jgi:hypothetical protein